MALSSQPLTVPGSACRNSAPADLPQVRLLARAPAPESPSPSPRPERPARPAPPGIFSSSLVSPLLNSRNPRSEHLSARGGGADSHHAGLSLQPGLPGPTTRRAPYQKAAASGNHLFA